MKNNIVPEKTGQIVLYQPDEVTEIEVKVENETVWLTASQMANLFEKEDSNIRRHILNVFSEGELKRENNVHFLHVNNIKKPVPFYNLDVIISVGYRVKSIKGTQFRIWANRILKEHLLHGYSVNHQIVALQERTDERFMQIEQRLDDQQQKVDFLVKTHATSDQQLFPNGCVFDAWAHLSELVRRARVRIELIDNYCDERTLSLLAKRADGVQAVIHSRYSEAFMQDLKKHNAQYAEIGFVQLTQKEHDRFLIVDDEVYILGDSLKNLGHSLTAVLKTRFTPEQILGALEVACGH